MRVVQLQDCAEETACLISLVLVPINLLTNHHQIIFDGRLLYWSEVQTTKPEAPGSNPGTYMYNLCMFIHYLVSITQVLKDT
jgi:hypothetical protein